MRDKTLSDTTTDAVLGSGIRGQLEGWKGARLGELHDDLIDLRSRVDDLNSGSSLIALSALDIAEGAEAAIKSAAESAASEIAMMGDEQKASRRFQLAFQVRHNIDRQPIVPNVYDSFLFLGGTTLIEGGATAAFFFGGGFVAGIAEAVILGLTISGVNILLSAGIGGFVCARYWNYGLKSRDPDITMTIKRWAARFGSLVTGGAIVILLVSSGIVRATGDTDHVVFTFENIGVAASNFHSLMLWGIGASFALLAWKKGFSAFADPYPGFGEAAKAVGAISESIKARHEEAFSEIEERYEDALDDIAGIADALNETQREHRDESQSLRHDRERLLGAISQLAGDFEAYRAEQVSLHQLVTGGKPVGHNTAGIDTERLASLVPAIQANPIHQETDFKQSSKDARALLAATRKAAIAAINSAFRTTLN